MFEILFDEKLEISLSEIKKFTDFVKGFANQQSLSDKLAYRLELVVDEILTNIVSYAMAEEIHLRVCRDGQVLRITIEDDGLEFNPLENDKPPELDGPLEEREIGGLGIFFANEMMNRLDYDYRNGKNNLQMEMDLDADHG